MRRLLLIIITLVIIIVFSGCDSQEDLASKQQKAIDNCILYINNSKLPQKPYIDLDIIEIENVTDSTWRSVYNDKHEEIKEAAIDLTDWRITIGDTIGHACVVLVCDSETCEVIGFIPIC